MILRKPYAFFIKHFKLFHAFFAGLVIYSIMRITKVMTFINTYLDSNRTLIKMTEVVDLFGTLDFVIPIFSAIFSVFLLSIMTMKKKPNKFYLYSTIVSFILLILNINGKSTIMTLTSGILPVGTLNTLGDFYFFALLACIGEAVIALSRAIGFNVSKFDFNNDILNFELDEKDNEEVEFVVDFDVNDIKRNMQKRIRYIKYFLKENKSLLRYFLIIVVSFTALFFGYNLLKYRKKVVSMSEFQNLIGGFEFEIKDTYLIDCDSRGNRLADNKYLVVLNIEAKNLDERHENRFPSAYMSINLGDDYYYSINKNISATSDLGKVYNGEKIKAGGKSNFLLVYEVPANHTKSKMYLSNGTDSTKSKYVKLNPEKILSAEDDPIENKLGEEINFEDSILKNTKIKIEDYSITKYIRLDYKYCINNKKTCIDSKEYLMPNNSTSNSDSVVLMLKGNFDFDKTIYISNFYSLLSNSGYIEYEIDGKLYVQSGSFEKLTSTKVKQDNIYYLAVGSNILDADEITLGFKLRNRDYRYTLKERG